MSEVAVAHPKTKVRTKKFMPRKYRVKMINDDFTPMAFVVAILLTVYKMSRADADALTMKIHNEGAGFAGTEYSKEVAETLIERTHAAARSEGFPLKCELVQS